MSGERNETITGWGRTPRVSAEVTTIRTLDDLVRQVAGGSPLLARGLGRSYGDTALAPHVADMTGFDNFIAFDPASGLLTCQAGLSLNDVLATLVPRGWFPAVTPGTRYVTIGGAIASDVHGKNHHAVGSFGDHVERMSVLTGTGEVLDVSRNQHADLFHATCGGLGLTGVVLDATIRLQPICSSWIDETILKTPDLESTLDAFESHSEATYSVAWIDLATSGSHLGRSLVMLGEHATDGDLVARRRAHRVNVPLDVPGFLMNRLTVRTFNELYYQRIRTALTHHRVPYEPYFYPLDAVGGWNRLYGSQGLLQWQCVVPERASLSGIVEWIVASGLAAPLAVLKEFGPGNDNLLSFPKPGYTLAVDFQAGAASRALCDELDALVLAAGGRLYLTKDARMSPATARACYPRLEEFEDVRKRYGATGVFASDQSRRLELA